jgi:hypothetical protein
MNLTQPFGKSCISNSCNISSARVPAMGPDYPRQYKFRQWLLQCCTEEPWFSSNVLYTDKVSGTQKVIVNGDNNHFWAEENS